MFLTFVDSNVRMYWNRIDSIRFFIIIIVRKMFEVCDLFEDDFDRLEFHISKICVCELSDAHVLAFTG